MQVSTFPRRRRRATGGWRLHVELAVLLGLLTVLGVHALAEGAVEHATPGVALTSTAGAAPGRTRVIDGDTLLLNGVTYRVANIDTPETGPRAQCDSERARADAATRHARALLARANVIAPEPQRLDRYGRVVALISLDGRDFGDLMMAAGHARPWRGRREPWCSPAS